MANSIAYKYLLSAWAHGKTVYQRDGEIFTLPNGKAPLYRGTVVEMRLCPEHQAAKWLPGPEAFEEVLGCSLCRGLTCEMDTDIHDRRWPLRVEDISVSEY